MDIFKQNKNLTITIVVLVILNLVTVSLLWLGKPKHDAKGPNTKRNEKAMIKEVLKEELKFSEEQAKQFLELRETHREKSVKLDEELKLLKREMFQGAMYGSRETISDSLLNLSLNKQGELEKITFDHFLKLKQICTPEQQEKLFELVERLIGPRQNEGPSPGGPKDEFRDGMPPPPPPRGEQPPERN